MVLAAVEQHEQPGRRLVDDDLAAAFLPARLRTLVACTRIGAVRRAMFNASERSGPGLWASIACRKRFIDERLSDPVHIVDAVVVLGAGFDTRGYRISRHSTMPVFEVDQQVNIDRKAAVVRRALGTQPPSVRLVAVDFERDDVMTALSDNGFRDTGATLFIWEGVTQYLTQEAVTATFQQLRALAPGTRLLFSYIRQDFIDGTTLYGADAVYRRFRQRRQVWHTGFVPEQLEEVLAGHGWRLIEQAGPGYYRDTYIKPTGRPLSASPLEWMAHAVKI